MIMFKKLCFFAWFREDCFNLNETLKEDCLKEGMEFYSYKRIKSVFNYGKTAIYAGLWNTRYVRFNEESYLLFYSFESLFEFSLELAILHVKARKLIIFLNLYTNYRKIRTLLYFLEFSKIKFKTTKKKTY